MQTHKKICLRIEPTPPTHLIWTNLAYFFTSCDCLNSYPQSSLTKLVVTLSQTFVLERVREKGETVKSRDPSKTESICDPLLPMEI